MDAIEETVISSASDSPWEKLVNLFRVIENQKRALVLFAIGVGELSDRNTLNELIPIINHLGGSEWSNSQFKKHVQVLESQQLVIKSEDAMLGTEEVSYHALSLLGHVSLLYLYLLHEPEEFSVDKTRLE